MYFPFSSLKHSFSAKVLGGSSGFCSVTLLCCELRLVPYQSPGSEWSLVQVLMALAEDMGLG